MSLVKGGLMVAILARELLTELEADTINANLVGEDLGLLDAENVVKLFKSLVAGESLRLYLILVRLLIKREAIACNRSIHGRAEVGVLFDDIAALGIDFNALASLVHLTEDLDTLALDLGEGTLFILSFLKTDFFCALSVLLF